MKYKGYSARVEFDSDAGVFHGEVEGVRDVITFEGTSVNELREAFHGSVNDYLAMCAEADEEPDRPYSGRFVVRVDPSLHREMARLAARNGQSLNAFAADAIRNRISSLRTPFPAEATFVNAIPAAVNDYAAQRFSPAPFVSNPMWYSNTPSSQTPTSLTPGGKHAS